MVIANDCVRIVSAIKGRFFVSGRRETSQAKALEQRSVQRLAGVLD